MATLTIRDLDDEVKARLRVRAAHHGRSMESEVRAILSEVTREAPRPAQGLGTAIQQLFAEIGGVDLEIPPRTEQAPAADLA